MGWLDRLVARDHRLAANSTAESATDRAARLRRQQHRARVQRHGDAAGQPFPRRLFRGD